MEQPSQQHQDSQPSQHSQSSQHSQPLQPSQAHRAIQPDLFDTACDLCRTFAPGHGRRGRQRAPVVCFPCRARARADERTHTQPSEAHVDAPACSPFGPSPTARQVAHRQRMLAHLRRSASRSRTARAAAAGSRA